MTSLPNTFLTLKTLLGSEKNVLLYFAVSQESLLFTAAVKLVKYNNEIPRGNSLYKKLGAYRTLIWG